MTVMERMIAQQLEMKKLKMDVRDLKKYTRILQREGKKVVLTTPEEIRIEEKKKRKERLITER